jgi:hypothetical protein
MTPYGVIATERVNEPNYLLIDVYSIYVDDEV